MAARRTSASSSLAAASRVGLKSSAARPSAPAQWPRPAAAGGRGDAASGPGRGPRDCRRAPCRPGPGRPRLAAGVSSPSRALSRCCISPLASRRALAAEPGNVDLLQGQRRLARGSSGRDRRPRFFVAIPSASRASGPIRAKASVACRRTKGSGETSKSARRLAAGPPSAPRLPSASIELWRTQGFGSSRVARRAVARPGRQPPFPVVFRRPRRGPWLAASEGPRGAPARHPLPRRPSARTAAGSELEPLAAAASPEMCSRRRRRPPDPTSTMAWAASCRAASSPFSSDGNRTRPSPAARPGGHRTKAESTAPEDYADQGREEITPARTRATPAATGAAPPGARCSTSLRGRIELWLTDSLDELSSPKGAWADQRLADSAGGPSDQRSLPPPWFRGGGGAAGYRRLDRLAAARANKRSVAGTRSASGDAYRSRDNGRRTWFRALPSLDAEPGVGRDMTAKRSCPPCPGMRACRPARYFCTLNLCTVDCL